ncbi:MAG: SpoIIE family protein phosphatase, partial [Clostridia bacterium]|nr:SpoIIE family protein phosphatase [Clostridia bacterium]
EEALFHPRKNVITRALGVEESISPEFNVFDLKADDKLLLCTDGLTNYVDSKTIVSVLTGEFEDMSKELVDIANKNGGGDNVTAVVVENN